MHQTRLEDKSYLTAAATDSHRMSISKILLKEEIKFDPIILPKKTIFQLVNLLEDYDGDVKISNEKSKIKDQLIGKVNALKKAGLQPGSDLSLKIFC